MTQRPVEEIAGENEARKQFLKCVREELESAYARGWRDALLAANRPPEGFVRLPDLAMAVLVKRAAGDEAAKEVGNG